MLQELNVALVRNRAEELGYDVWKYFVIPPFFDSLDLGTARKPRAIIGGRGCGKTMLLRYLSHQSMFSKDRQVIPTAEVRQIGLYWRADTQFANALTGRDIPDTTWQAAFQHAMTITLALEILRSLRNAAASNCDAVRPSQVAELEFDKLKQFGPLFSGRLQDLQAGLEADLRTFQMWANNPHKLQEPLFLPGRDCLTALIALIKGTIPSLCDTVFMVYIDEYENLCEYQQRLINTYMKHSEPPLIFNIAAKRNAFRDRRTIGNEAITDIADYRTYDIEELMCDQFGVFAAEILFLKLSDTGADDSLISTADLRDPMALPRRRDLGYKDRMLQWARSVFPGPSQEELAANAIQDAAIARRLRRELEEALKRANSNVPVERFIRPTHPQASIVCSSLLYRDGLSAESVAEEFDKLESGQENKFTGNTDWVHNNFLGCLLRLYNLQSKVCPCYAGFDVFCLLSRGNLRHFLELCHRSVSRTRVDPSKPFLSIPPEDQAQAALQASSAFLREVRSFGCVGNALHGFVLTLGSLFALAHERPTQSESEVSHFAVARGAAGLQASDSEFLNEAVKWSVLFEERETKIKDDLQASNVQWVLNPIYAPYFRITYRKRRKVDISVDELIVLIRGNYDERRALLKKYQARWQLTEAEMSPTLFSHLEGE